jgi:hypothetical protein
MKVQEKIEMIECASLVPYARNSRTHSKEQIAQIAASIKEFGFTNPVLIDADGGIVAGHGRVMGATLIGMLKVPCLRVGWLTEDQKKAYVIADNQLALNAGWDNEVLTAELKDLQSSGFALDLLGFNNEELDSLLGYTEELPGKDPEECPPPVVNPTSVLGDIWLLGQHRLICGDCTTMTAMSALMNGEMADVCWTDPPYNVAYGDKAEYLNKGDNSRTQRNTDRILNDDMDDASFSKFLGDFYRTAFAVMKPGASIYVAHAETERSNFTREMLNNGFKLSGVVIWRKNALVLGRSDYQWIHEPILYGWKMGGGAQMVWRTQENHRRNAWRRLSICQTSRWSLGVTHGGRRVRCGWQSRDRGIADIGDRRRQTKAQRCASHHEAGRIDRAPVAQQRSQRRYRSGCIRRKWQHTDGSRTARHEGETFRTSPWLCRRNHPALAGIHGPASNTCRNRQTIYTGRLSE